MAVEIRVPALGESIVEATVGKWLKREGDRVAAGETLAELETDKVNVEVTAEQARRQAEVRAAGAEAMHERLRLVDPVAALAILPGNVRRVVRALEVVELTGRPFSATLPQPDYDVPAVQIGLTAPRDVLDDRIARRVVRMWAEGLVDETLGLVREGLLDGRTAPRALGYAQVRRMLEGEMDDAAAQLDTVQATRRFARRQETWFRRDPRITWLPFDAPDLVPRALAAVRSAVN